LQTVDRKARRGPIGNCAGVATSRNTTPSSEQPRVHPKTEKISTLLVLYGHQDSYLVPNAQHGAHILEADESLYLSMPRSSFVGLSASSVGAVEHGFLTQMRSAIGHITRCQRLLLLRRKHLSFSLNRNVERVNRPSGALRGGGAFLARTSTLEKSAPTGPHFPSASRRTDRPREPTRLAEKPPYPSHCGRPTPSHPSLPPSGHVIYSRICRGYQWAY